MHNRAAGKGFCGAPIAANISRKDQEERVRMARKYSPVFNSIAKDYT